jgi:hypothetical protein
MNTEAACMKDEWEVSRWVARDEPFGIGNEGGEVQREAGIRESYLTKLRPDLVVESSGGPPCSIAIESRNEDNKLMSMVRVLACMCYKLNICVCLCLHVCRSRNAHGDAGSGLSESDAEIIASEFQAMEKVK